MSTNPWPSVLPLFNEILRQLEPPSPITQEMPPQHPSDPFSLSVTVKSDTGNQTSGNAGTRKAIINIKNIEMVLTAGSVTVVQGADGNIAITANPVEVGERALPPTHPLSSEPEPPSPVVSSSGVSITEIIGFRRPEWLESRSPGTAALSAPASPGSPRHPPSLRRARRFSVRTQFRRGSFSEVGTPVLRSLTSAPPPYSPAGWASTAEEVSIMEEILEELEVAPLNIRRREN
ncbi:hypothetical protein CPLU01_07991 [Colletotrichum plurivorum]|uniref:Uncharacterized protein n=1 Tax=Colletotrichum plurivorum TaxID=2175906 RepID=A0A8H6KDA1_9PEZI|nr:hypothetical protein CPLU01_07991 [Colletotrichum plurivorum]